MTDLELIQSLQDRGNFLLHCSWKTEEQFLDWVYSICITALSFNYMQGSPVHLLESDDLIDKFLKTAQENGQSMELTLDRIIKAQDDWENDRIEEGLTLIDPDGFEITLTKKARPKAKGFGTDRSKKKGRLKVA